MNLQFFAHRPLISSTLTVLLFTLGSPSNAAELRPVPLQSTIKGVQPMTGIVLWATNEHAAKAPIQLEFAYLGYDQIVREKGMYDWTAVETLLDQVAGRGHQLILRWHDTYVGKPTRVPAYIKALADYRETVAPSEKKETGFPDWSHPELRRFIPEFYTQFAKHYDRDPRLAFVQTGFGLWAEYHIYDGPMEPGKTFPDQKFQTEFAKHLAAVFKETPWMISVDAAAKHTPFADNKELLALNFGVFDDSFNHANHAKSNEPNWNTFGRDRWRHAPAGGEFSFFEKRDQKEALSPHGPHGIPFEEQAAKFHLSFIIGDDQPRFLKGPERLISAGQACGYRFEVTRFDSSPERSLVEVRNNGIAPIYHDAFPAVNGVRSTVSLKGLLPGESRQFPIPAGGDKPALTLESDRLVKGQGIEFEAALTGS